MDAEKILTVEALEGIKFIEPRVVGSGEEVHQPAWAWDTVDPNVMPEIRQPWQIMDRLINWNRELDIALEMSGVEAGKFDRQIMLTGNTKEIYSAVRALLPGHDAMLPFFYGDEVPKNRFNQDNALACYQLFTMTMQIVEEFHKVFRQSDDYVKGELNLHYDYLAAQGYREYTGWNEPRYFAMSPTGVDLFLDFLDERGDVLKAAIWAPVEKVETKQRQLQQAIEDVKTTRAENEAKQTVEVAVPTNQLLISQQTRREMEQLAKNAGSTLATKNVAAVESTVWEAFAWGQLENERWHHQLELIDLDAYHLRKEAMLEQTIYQLRFRLNQIQTEYRLTDELRQLFAEQERLWQEMIESTGLEIPRYSEEYGESPYSVFQFKRMMAEYRNKN